MAVLDRIENGLIHFDDGGTLPLPPGVTAEWEPGKWSCYVFRTPAGREGKGLPVVITRDTARPERALVERAMAWLSQQESVKEAARGVARRPEGGSGEPRC